MELPVVTPPLWVNSQALLKKLADALVGEPRIAIDTESNSLFAYREKVCLIQISTPAADYLIDPFAIADLSPLAPVFADPAVEKIFHAAEYDLICLKRDYSFAFNTLFDTMLAARILGLPEVGLGALLQSRFGVTLDKRYQRANWGIRPLSEGMLAYGALDTHYLFNLRDSLNSDLAAQGLAELASEDFRYISQAEGHGQNGNSLNCWKVAGAHPVNPHQAAVLDLLCRYRDEQARLADLPHFKVLSNQLLVDLSTAEVDTLDDLAKVPGTTPRLLRRHGQRMLELIKEGRSAQPITKPHRPRLDAEYLKRLDRLRGWRKSLALEKKVESDVVLPRELMESIACHHPRTLTDLTELMMDFPYRRRQYGERILDALKKEEPA